MNCLLLVLGDPLEQHCCSLTVAVLNYCRCCYPMGQPCLSFVYYIIVVGCLCVVDLFTVFPKYFSSLSICVWNPKKTKNVRILSVVAASKGFMDRWVLQTNRTTVHEER